MGTSYTVIFSADFDGARTMGSRHVDIIEGYSTFSDIPKIIETMGYRNVVIISATLNH